MSETFLNNAQLTGLSADARRTEILRAKQVNALPRGVVSYSQIVVDDAATTGGTERDVTGLSDTFVAVPGRRYKATAMYEVTRSAASGEYAVRLRVGGTQLTEQIDEGSGVVPVTETLLYVSNTSLQGELTWRLTVQLTGGAGTITVGAGATYPAFLLVEDIGPL